MNTLEVLVFSFAAVGFVYSACNNRSVMLQCGDGEADKHLELEVNITIPIRLNESYFLDGEKLDDTIYISENGNVSFGGYEFHEIPSELPLLHHHPLIAGFWTDIHASIVIYYAEMNDSESDIRRKNVFRERASKIKALLTEGLEITEIEDFIVTEMFIITWVDSTTYCTPEQELKFQIVLATDSNTNRTYLLLLYDEIGYNICDTTVIVGFSAGVGCQPYVYPVSSDEFFNKSIIYRLDKGIRRECDFLSAPTNGHIELCTGATGLVVASYICDEGYQLVGNHERRCQCNGEWAGSNATCEVDCGPLEDPADGKVYYTSRLLGSVATYTCNSGCEPDGCPTRTCTESGWSDDEPTCPDITCEDLKSPTNGMIQYSSNCSGLVAKYECNEGAELVGNSERVCQCDGTWSGSNASCVCGGELLERSGYFETPGWPERYPQANLTCVWTAVDPKSVIIFEIDRKVYGINGNDSNNCGDDYIEFFDTPERSVDKFCSLDLKSEVVVIYTGCATVVFKGTVDPDRPNDRKGVRIKYTYEPIIG